MNRPVLHLLLWGRSDRGGIIKLDQHRLADELGASRFSLARVLQMMVAEQRLVKVGRSKFVVSDPARWLAAREA